MALEARTVRRALTLVLCSAALVLNACSTASGGPTPRPLPPPVRASPTTGSPARWRSVRIGVAPPTPASSPEREFHAFPSAKGHPRVPPAIRYGRLTASACLAESNRRQLPVQWLSTGDPPVGGVGQPLRLVGPLHGVWILAVGARAPGTAPVHDLLDCRLLLALDDLASLLAQHHVREVRHLSLYRPRARVRETGRPSEHGRGLAIDIGELVLADGTRVSVLDDWEGQLGEPVCGTDATELTTYAAFTLRSVVCRAAEVGLFHVILTPNYNHAHRNHLHLDVSATKETFYLR